MLQWDSAQYLKFENQRTRPAVDLAERIPLCAPETILDVGCGPGNSAAVLKKRFPNAHIIGIDNSPQMIESAKISCPSLHFELIDANADLSKLGAFDLVFSNACIQWIPDHSALIPKLFDLVHPGGCLAIQIPMNQDAPIQQLIRQTVMHPAWKSKFNNPRIFHTLTPVEYYDILSACSPVCDIWTTTYFHILPDTRAILEWYRGTGLRPYLEVLSEDERDIFEKEILEQITLHYPKRGDGTVVFPFPRFFMTAQKPYRHTKT